MFRAYQDGEPIENLIRERGLLYRAIARRIWAPQTLGLNRPRTEPAALAPQPAGPAVDEAMSRCQTF